MLKSLRVSLLILILFSSLGARVGRTVAYSGPRKMAMGGCGVAMIDKRESLYYNPATIVDIDRALVLPIIQSTTIVGYDTLSNISQLGDVTTAEDDDEKIAEAKKIIPSKLGMGYVTSFHYIGNTSSGPDSMATNFAIGAYANGKIGANLLNKLSPRLEAIGYVDVVGPTFTIARPLAVDEDYPLKNPKIGFTVKNINRYSLYDKDSNDELARLELLDLIGEEDVYPINVRAGHGVGLDMGAIADMDTFMGPAKVGVAIYNLSTTLTGKQTEGVGTDNANVTDYKEDIPVMTTVGFAVKAAPLQNIDFFGLLNNATYAADFDVISQDTSWLKRIHLGMEQLFWNDLMAFRMGLNQGYPTMGVGFNLGVFHAGFSYFVEEFGEEIGDNPQAYYILDGGFYW